MSTLIAVSTEDLYRIQGLDVSALEIDQGIAVGDAIVEEALEDGRYIVRFGGVHAIYEQPERGVLGRIYQ